MVLKIGHIVIIRGGGFVFFRFQISHRPKQILIQYGLFPTSEITNFHTLVQGKYLLA